MAGHYRGRVTGPGIDEDVCINCSRAISFDPDGTYPSGMKGTWTHQATESIFCHVRDYTPEQGKLIAAPVGAGPGAPVDPTPEPKFFFVPEDGGEPVPLGMGDDSGLTLADGRSPQEDRHADQQYIYEKNLALTLSTLERHGISVGPEDLTRIKAHVRGMPFLIETVYIEDHRIRTLPRRIFRALPGLAGILALAAIGYGIYALWEVTR